MAHQIWLIRTILTYSQLPWSFPSLLESFAPQPAPWTEPSVLSSSSWTLGSELISCPSIPDLNIRNVCYFYIKPCSWCEVQNHRLKILPFKESKFLEKSDSCSSANLLWSRKCSKSLTVIFLAKSKSFTNTTGLKNSNRPTNLKKCFFF